MRPMRADADSLLMDTRAAVAELMAERPKCNAITTPASSSLWRAHMVTGTECLTSMPVDGDVLTVLRTQSANAMATIDRLA